VRAGVAIRYAIGRAPAVAYSERAIDRIIESSFRNAKAKDSPPERCALTGARLAPESERIFYAEKQIAAFKSKLRKGQ